MRVSYNWLKEYIDLDLSPEEVAEKLTTLGLEVDYIEDWKKKYKDLLIGQIQEIKKHPRADNLTLVKVGLGGKDLQVVCGADNVQRGQKVVLAPAGTTLPGGQEVKKTEIRGEISQGMICSADELNLQEEQAEGILVLDKDAVPGEKFAPYFNLDDHIFVLDLTPNYGYALNLLGVARELAAVWEKEIKYPSITAEQESGRAEDLISVEVEEPQNCPRYTARIVEGVKVEESPWWLKVRLLAAGLRPVNNIADITNYVMLEMGQPLHAFDYDCIKEKKIIVRNAREGEKLTTLDGRERELAEHNLVIADIEKPLALGGVMGGLESEVTPKTYNILLEAACFDPASVRKTAKEFLLYSPSSHRFERGIDIENITRASRRAAQLMGEIAGGEVIGGIVDIYPQVKEPLLIKVRPQRINEVLGTDISRMEIKSILEKLHFKVKDSRRKEGAFRVQVPSFRNDVKIEADLIEEVARVFGYEEIPAALPRVDMELGKKKPGQDIEEKIRSVMHLAGYHQTFNLPLISPGENFQQHHSAPLKITNPLSSDNSFLRQEILPGLLRSLAFNARRQVREAALFEVGDVFPGKGINQKSTLAAVIMGAVSDDAPWLAEAPEFFDLKGVLEKLSGELGLELTLNPASCEFLHPGRQAEVLINGEKVGYIGELHPRLEEKLRFPSRVGVLEIELIPLFKEANLTPDYRGVPRFPAISRDLALIVKEEVSTGEVFALLQENGGQFLENMVLFDLYRGEQIPPDCKSLAFRLVFRNPERTLTDKEIEEIMDRIIARTRQELEAEVRQ